MKLFLSLYMLSALSLASMSQESKCQNHLTHDNKHTFALTSMATEMTDGGRDVLYKHAAEACYQNCHSAELMSLSKNYWKDHTPITLLDRATPFLIESGFFQVNQTYFVNQIVVAEEGPAGLGCLVMESSSDFSLHSIDDPACSSTESVVCGMPGTQSINETETSNNTVVTQKNDTSSTINPDKDAEYSNDPVINISSGIADAITRATSNDGNGSINGTVVDHQMTPSDKEEEKSAQDMEQIPDQEKQDDDAAAVEESPSLVESAESAMHDKDASSAVSATNASAVPQLTTAATAPAENDSVYPLTIGDINYKVIRLQKIHTTTESAATMCQTHHDKIGSLYSLSIPNFSSWFQRVHPMGKTIIGSWNGDSYGANGPQCLVYSAAQGVHLGACTDASVLLCESTLFTAAEFE